jgi:hypothetical protein
MVLAAEDTSLISSDNGWQWNATEEILGEYSGVIHCIG